MRRRKIVSPNKKELIFISDSPHISDNVALAVENF